MVLKGKETINIDSIEQLDYLRSKYEKNKKMNLFAHHQNPLVTQ